MQDLEEHLILKQMKRIALDRRKREEGGSGYRKENERGLKCEGTVR